MILTYFICILAIVNSISNLRIPIRTNVRIEFYSLTHSVLIHLIVFRYCSSHISNIETALRLCANCQQMKRRTKKTTAIGTDLKRNRNIVSELNCIRFQEKVTIMQFMLQ